MWSFTSNNSYCGIKFFMSNPLKPLSFDNTIIFYLLVIANNGTIVKWTAYLRSELTFAQLIWVLTTLYCVKMNLLNSLGFHDFHAYKFLSDVKNWQRQAQEEITTLHHYVPNLTSRVFYSFLQKDDYFWNWGISNLSIKKKINDNNWS